MSKSICHRLCWLKRCSIAPCLRFVDRSKLHRINDKYHTRHKCLWLGYLAFSG